ncbi:Auxin efflux carrier [Macleaya cordata]|uniref:Auxin efflux carrier n=1 Tax=Macleaya cordata TaxID=56857 RepID=A0A200PYL2_MACCD|nr:Auxin efflux carrier [Macleaya cordata]
MGFFTLLEVATMPVLQVLIISILGAFMATGYCNLLTADARRQMNKIVFVVFTPSLMFASLAKTVTLQDIISWWFMPINIGLTFLLGGILGWIVVKILKPEPHLEGLVIASCSAGNLGNLLLIVVPAICNEDGSPFGDHSICSTVGLSYASFSMALGGFFIWSYTYHLIRTSGITYRAMQIAKESIPKTPNKDLDANAETKLLKGEDEDQVAVLVDPNGEENESLAIVTQTSVGKLDNEKQSPWDRVTGILHQIVDELLAPPTIAAILGFLFGATPWLKNLIIGEGAPLRVIQDSIKLLGDGTIPCITLILGGNLTQGLRSAKLKPMIIIGVICVRYMILPVIGMGVVKAAGEFGFLPADPLFRYVLMVQFTLPPAMNIGTMTQLFDVGQEECSILFLWTYLVASLALTVWSTVYMYILS